MGTVTARTYNSFAIYIIKLANLVGSCLSFRLSYKNFAIIFQLQQKFWLNNVYIISFRPLAGCSYQKRLAIQKHNNQLYFHILFSDLDYWSIFLQWKLTMSVAILPPKPFIHSVSISTNFLIYFTLQIGLSCICLYFFL